ncbi:hypothetical protein BH23CHL7_BH23CHL7_24160 [soil metagenome]
MSAHLQYGLALSAARPAGALLLLALLLAALCTVIVWLALAAAPAADIQLLAPIRWGHETGGQA